MLKALLKKQAGELLSFVSGSGNSSKAKKKTGILYAIIFAYVFVAGGIMMYNIADSLCAPLTSVGMDWLFFAIIGFFSIGLSIILGIFTSQPMLYDAKDNDFLLSLPIPASKILFSRMFLLYATNLLCSLLIFVPALVVYNQTVDIKALALVFQVLILFVLPLLSLVVECVVGWIVALVSSRMRKKNIVTLVLSIALLAGYFYLTMKMPEYMGYIVENAQQVGSNLANAFYPFYQMGLGASGEIKGLLIFVGICVALFAIVYFVLSLSFIKIATTKKGAKKVKYTEQTLMVNTVGSALFKKELTRFFGTVGYMLNCGLGVIFHIAIAVFAIVKKNTIVGIFGVVPVFADHTLAMIVAVTCVISTMNMITAPSVSLEGKNIWILQTMPIEPWQVLKAKLKLHLVINLPSSILCVAVLGIVMGMSASEIFIAELFTVAYVFFCAIIGLVINLKLPKLDWTTEMVVIKQSASVLVTMLINFSVIFTLGGLYYLLQRVLMAETILLMFVCVISIANVLLKNSLKTKLSQKFTYLS